MEDILDIDQLAVLMGDSVDIIERNMKQNPIQVPPLMYVRGNPALKRWRLDTVGAWVRGREAGRSSTKGDVEALSPDLGLTRYSWQNGCRDEHVLHK